MPRSQHLQDSNGLLNERRRQLRGVLESHLARVDDEDCSRDAQRLVVLLDELQGQLDDLS